MDLIKEYNKNRTFKNDSDFFESLKDIFMFGNIKSEYKSNNLIDNKELINSILIDFLKNLLSKELLTNRKEKTAAINLISEMDFRNEILELIKEKNNNTVQISERLGAKFMSSVDKKKN
ncbi:hypothetical protein CMU96_06920 [Elizabethkingia anophelis]|nr:hypothetical protein [Elizabethkingia anophelis]MCT3812723.1 hypothetical protein [Elizabethkingia anophelis]MCT3819940.1 hypothetical protein [Elizabethkingia anophelis]MCT3942325.1 hypothetical protein [Elizabethkingia anophelis]MCT4195063.1 hypothetical protein [Elizabethkingia anophelis]